ncbi:MAG TPA: glycosyltransferase family 4 protein, partial [Jiangellaceae bacterium]
MTKMNDGPLELVIVLATSTGGVGTHVRSLVERLPGLGVQVTVAAPAETGERFGFAEAGARFVPVEIATAPRPQQDLAAVRELRRVLGSADVVHAHGFRAAALTGLALGRRRRGRTPFVATWHNAVLGGGPKRTLLAGLETLAARRADVTLGASSDLVERARRLGAADARLAPVAAPAMAAPQRDREAVRAELGAGERPVVLAVGRLAPQKDYDTLLAAVAAWGRRDPQPLVVIAGDGPEQARLQTIVDDGGLDVRLLGRRDDVPDLLAAADLYLITSTWEARALVVQEAMRAGVPVVATEVGGLPELVGDAAVTVPPGDPRAVADAVVGLLDDPDRRAALAAAGRTRSESWPDEDDTARHAADVYRELTAPRPADAAGADGVAVIIPAKDEQDRVGVTVGAALGIAGVDVVVVVDDGSVDRTSG